MKSWSDKSDRFVHIFVVLIYVSTTFKWYNFVKLSLWMLKRPQVNKSTKFTTLIEVDKIVLILIQFIYCLCLLKIIHGKRTLKKSQGKTPNINSFFSLKSFSPSLNSEFTYFVSFFLNADLYLSSDFWTDICSCDKHTNQTDALIFRLSNSSVGRSK